MTGRRPGEISMTPEGNDLSESITAAGASIPPTNPAPPPKKGWRIVAAVINILAGFPVLLVGIAMTILCLGLGGGGETIFMVGIALAGAALMASGVCLLIA